MRLIKFINESNEINEIKNKCKKYLKETSHNSILYRGQWDDDLDPYLNGVIKKEKTIKNRLPRNTSKEIHEIFNNGFKQVFGKNLRTESVFTTSNDRIAMGYGNAYLFFPTDPFEIYWSPYIHDLFSFYKNLKDHITFKNFESDILSKNKNPNIIITILYLINENNSNSWNNETNVLTQNIINKYSSILPNDLNTKNIKEKLKPYIGNSIKDFINLFYKKGNLQAAIKSHNEVMVDCNEFYLISPKNDSIYKIWEK